MSAEETSAGLGAVRVHALNARLEAGLQQIGLVISQSQTAQLLAYVDLIAKWNRVYNLTAVRDPGDMLSQHLLDCLAIIPSLKRWVQARQVSHGPVRCLDVGSGAGLPGVVIALVEPSWTIVCADTVAKKASFIRQVAAELGLSNLISTHERVEHIRDASYTLVTSRAFASLGDMLSLTRACLAPGGVWAAMKAHLLDDELRQVPPDIDVFHVEQLSVPELAAERCLVWFRRTY